MDEGTRRALVFGNLLNGVAVPAVMEAFRLSEAEVMADFDFVITKIRSYRFERGIPLIQCGTITEAKAHKVELLDTMRKCNLNKQAVYSRVDSLPLEADTGGVMSLAEQKMLEMRMRAMSQ